MNNTLFWNPIHRFQYTETNSRKNSFEKDFLKLLSNNVFGKTTKSFWKTVDVKIITDEKKLLKYSSKPTFVTAKSSTAILSQFTKKKEAITLKTPTYVGTSILDLSRTLMYDFHYNYIKVKYHDKAKLLFTDIGSLINVSNRNRRRL